ncbi:MAG: zinc ribbon domain-containing protein [Acidobacteriota bacterium]
MSKPEIARRCPSCGASIRAHELFCPQCGKPLSDRKTDSTEAGPSGLSELSQAGTTELIADPAMLREQDVLRNQEIESGPVTLAPTRAFSESQKRLDRSRGTMDRARAARNEIGKDVSQSVGKLREISTVVLDGASYDPSMRFILVAAVLFVLSLIILVLSHVVT